MNATQLRRNMQTKEQMERCETIRHELSIAVRNTRIHFGGISLMEIAEVIKENLAPEEVESLKNDL